MKMEPIVSSETSAIRTQTPGNYPKRNKLHLDHGESLKTRMMSLALLFHYLMLNMFRMLIHPSSGACDLFVEWFHGLYCSGSMCVGVTLWFGWGGVVSVCRLQPYVTLPSNDYCKSLLDNCTQYSEVFLFVLSLSLSLSLSSSLLLLVQTIGLVHYEFQSNPTPFIFSCNFQAECMMDSAARNLRTLAWWWWWCRVETRSRKLKTRLHSTDVYSDRPAQRSLNWCI